jgi:uncharacterized protein (TIGR03083 family)
MALLRVDASPLIAPLRVELLALLAGLAPGEWLLPTACPGWPVHGVAAHLLGVELGNVSVRRDGWALRPAGDEDPDSWLNAFNQQWVEAAGRISPPLLIECLGLAARRFEEHIAGLDPDAMGGPVRWATGLDPAPVWLDVAREYMERYVHQQQIRDATGRPALGARFTYPVLAAAAHALPRALAGVSRPDGTVATFTADGAGGGRWYVVCRGDGWQLGGSGPPPSPPACDVSTTVAGAIKLYSRDPAAQPLVRRGDPALTDALSRVTAVLG